MKHCRSVILFICASLAAPVAAQAPGGQGFAFDIEYTPAAARAAAQTRYPMQVMANYDGDPVPARVAEADEMSETIILGQMSAPLPNTAGRHSVAMTGLDRARLSWVREAMVDFNVMPVVPERDISRGTVDTTIICQAPPRQSIAQATAAPLRVICRTMRETR